MLEVPTLRDLNKPGVLPVVAFVLVLAWAVVAVIMLTLTLLAADEIDKRAAVIVNRVPPIEEDLENIELAATTARLAEQIRVAVAPLPEQLTLILEEVRSIDATAGSILNTSREINAKVESIEATARSILATAESIRATAVSIENTVEPLEATVESIYADVNAIEADVAQINTRFRKLLAEVRSTNVGVAGINLRLEVVIDLANSIEQNLATIRALAEEINENAAAIEESPLLLKEPGEDVRELVEELTEELTGTGQSGILRLPGDSAGRLPLLGGL